MALVLLTAIIVLGVLGPLRVEHRAWPRFAIRTVHRDISLLALLVIVIHVVMLVLDGYVQHSAERRGAAVRLRLRARSGPASARWPSTC